MSTPLVIIGAGGFGREVLDVVEAVNGIAAKPVFRILGVIDASPSESNLNRLSARGYQYLGSETDWLDSEQEASFVVAIGNPVVRERVEAQFRASGRTAATLVHPDATVGSAGTIGAGSVICAGALISTNVVIGRHVHLNPGAVVGHDAVLGDFCSINPSATISGDVELADRVLVGAGAVILQGLQVGEGAVVGAAACVTRSVAAHLVVKGIPAK